MKVEYNGFIYEELDTESSNEKILQNFLDRNMVFDGDYLVHQWTDLTFEDLTVTRTPYEIGVIAKRYLAETDWYVSREAETGKAVPSDVLTKRAQARIDASS